LSRKLVTLSIVLAMLLVMSFSLTIGAQEVTLKFLHRWTQEPDSTFFEEVVANYEEQNPNINIDMEVVSNDPFKEKIKIILGTENAPDVFFTWPGEFTNRFIRAGQVMDLTSYMEDGWGDTLIDSVVEPFRYEGKVYGAPYRLDAKVFVYNTKIFEEVGVEEPETFDEFLTVLEKIDNAGYIPIAFGNMFPWAVSHYMGQLNAYCVPYDVYMEDLDPAVGDFAHPGYLMALEKYEQLTPYFNASSNAIRHDEARISLFNGEAAMMYLEIIEIPTIEQQAPEEFRNNYDVFVMPKIEGAEGDQSALIGYPEGFVISANTEHPEEAVAFLKYLTGKEVGQKEAQDLLFVNGVKNVVSKGEIPDSVYNTTQLVLETERLVNWFDSSLHAEIWSVAGSELQKLTDGVATPEEVLEEIRAAAEDVRAQF